MTKYHINAKGEPGVCTAREGNCPLKESDGSQTEHYDSPEEAQQAYEKKMSTGNTMAGVRRKKPSSKINAATALKTIDGYLDKGYISSSEVASHSSKEWSEMADALSQERENVLKRWDNDQRTNELDKKYGVLKAINDSETLQAEIYASEEKRSINEYFDSEEYARLNEIRDQMEEDPAVEKLATELEGDIDRAGELDHRIHLAQISAEIAKPRTFEGQKVPAGHAVFRAIYDTDDKVVAHYYHDYDHNSQRVNNSQGRPLKVRPSQSNNKEEARERNEAKGFRVGKVIAPATPTLWRHNSKRVNSETETVDVPGTKPYINGNRFPVTDGNRPTPNLQNTRKMLDRVRSRSLHYRSNMNSALVTPDSKNVKEFVQTATPTSYRE